MRVAPPGQPLTAAAASKVISDAAEAAPAQPGSALPDDGPASFQEKVTVMVELADRPGALVYADSLKAAIARAGGSFANMSQAAQDAAKSAAAGESRIQVAKIEAAQQAILPTLNSMALGGKIIFRTKSACNGISMYAMRG